MLHAVPDADDPRLLVAIPVHNEIDHATKLLPRLVDEVPHDVLFVDDASTDGTTELLEAAAERGDVHYVRHEANRGYGGALVTAFEWADARGYEWVVTMDCDEQHDPANLPAFLDAIRDDDSDLISGTRYAPESAGGDLPPAERRLVNMILTGTINDLFGWSLSDTFCGFKAHRVGPTMALELDEFGYAFPMQLWPRAFDRGLRVREIPVRRIYNDLDRSFGHDVRAGDLDDAAVRLGHYLDVLRHELCSLGLPELRDALPAAADEAIELLHNRSTPQLREALRQGISDAAIVPCP
ncbi:MAG: glycosyltransferase family 2 protein [Planctomycetota bacterium]